MLAYSRDKASEYTFTGVAGMEAIHGNEEATNPLSRTGVGRLQLKNSDHIFSYPRERTDGAREPPTTPPFDRVEFNVMAGSSALEPEGLNPVLRECYTATVRATPVSYPSNVLNIKVPK